MENNDNSPVFDLHCDSVLRLVHRNLRFKDDNVNSQVDIPKMRKGNVEGMFYALWSDPIFRGEDSVKQTDFLLKRALKEFEDCKEDMSLCRNFGDVLKAQQENKISAFLAIEGGFSINDSIKNLEHFYNEGVRLMTLTHTVDVNWAGSGNGESGNGLSPLGKDIIEAMNGLGMIVDVAHTNEKTTLDAVKCSKKPVVCSHSGARKVLDNSRLATDEMIKAVGESGGVFGVAMLPVFFPNTDQSANKKWLDKVFKELNNTANLKSSQEIAQKNFQVVFEAPYPGQLPKLEGVLEHFDYIMDLIGEDAVAIGTDFDGMPFAPLGLENASKFDNLRELMKKHGYSQTSIEKILSGNVKRVLAETLK
jgi:membrane dipeptidase